MGVPDFHVAAVQALIAKAVAAGVPVPEEVRQLPAALHDGSYPATWWARHHPDDDRLPCCDGSAMFGPERCTCWEPVFELEQQPPRPPTGPGELEVRREKCVDCAFRRGSPELSDPWTREHLYDSARAGKPFWCHQGMRRPARWVHPDGRVVEGSPDDWSPPIAGGIPYRADGAPAQLCAGWAQVAANARRKASA